MYLTRAQAILGGVVLLVGLAVMYLAGVAVSPTEADAVVILNVDGSVHSVELEKGAEELNVENMRIVWIDDTDRS